MNLSTHANPKRRNLYRSLSMLLEVMLIAAVLPALLHGVPVLTHVSI